MLQRNQSQSYCIFATIIIIRLRNMRYENNTRAIFFN